MNIDMIFKAIEIASLVFGVIYIVMQVFQHKWMWYADLITCVAAGTVAFHNDIWATVGLNVYMFTMGVIGISKWKKLDGKTEKGALHIVRLPRKTAILSIAAILVGGALIFWLLTKTSDPAPLADSALLILTVFAAWWLTKSYIEQWYLWLVANVTGIVLFASQGLYWMSTLYFAYLVFAVIGIFNWRRKGQYVE